MKSKLITTSLSLLLCFPAFSQKTEAEKSFIQENMEFAAKQYHLMMKTPAQGKENKGIMPHSMRKDGTVCLLYTSDAADEMRSV